MSMTLAPGERTGCVRIPASKSQAHRLLICAALGAGETTVECDGVSADIEATVRCLSTLGAHMEAAGEGRFKVSPITRAPEGRCELYCGESGSTLRFLLPVAGALGVRAVFHMEGRLPERPLAPLDDVLRAHGMSITRQGGSLVCEGKLTPGEYEISGGVSSQYISGLLLALPRLDADSRLTVTGTLESAGYVAMTEDALRLAGIEYEKHGQSYDIPGRQAGRLPEACRAEGDWSNAAFFLCMGALSRGGVTVRGLDMASLQGDRAVLDILRRFGAEVEPLCGGARVRRGALRAIEIDAAQIPDLVPVLGVTAAAARGTTRIINAGRLRLKESDRLKSTARLIASLGGTAEELPDGLIIHGREALDGGSVETWRDHRIAMAAAAAACVCRSAVSLDDSRCVEKSYPRFWEDYASLELQGGKA